MDWRGQQLRVRQCYIRMLDKCQNVSRERELFLSSMDKKRNKK